MKIIAEAQFKIKQGNLTRHIFIMDDFQKLFISYPSNQPSEEKIQFYRELITESTNMMEYNTRLFDKMILKKR